MSAMQEWLYRLNLQFCRITDWLLIAIGMLLIVKAVLVVDVSIARYVIMGIGALLVGAGFFYRHRRKQRHR